MVSHLRELFRIIVVAILFVVLFVVAFFLMITKRFGIGEKAYVKLQRYLQNLIPVYVMEVQVYKYPIPPEYQKEGHIRFTAKRTKNLKGKVLDMDKQEAMLYIARVNNVERLYDATPDTIRQLQYSLAKLRFHSETLYIYGPNSENKMDKAIHLK